MSFLTDDVTFLNTRTGRIWFALFLTIAGLSLIEAGPVVFDYYTTGQLGSCGGGSVGGECSSLSEALEWQFGLFFFISVLSFGLPVIFPMLCIWALLEIMHLSGSKLRRREIAGSESKQ